MWGVPSMLAKSILSLVPRQMLEERIVAVALPDVVLLLRDVRSLFVSFWPKFCHLDPGSLPLGVVAR